MEQVAVSGVHLDGAEASLLGARRSVGESLHDAYDVRLLQRHGSRVSVGERERARSDDGPAALARWQWGPPWSQGARTLACDRHARAAGRPSRPGILRNARCGRAAHLLGLPEPEVVRRDAPARLDGRRLEDDQPGPAHGASAQVHEVPVTSAALLRRVLAHRRDGDAVPQGDTAKLQGREEHAGIPPRTASGRKAEADSERRG